MVVAEDGRRRSFKARSFRSDGGVATGFPFDFAGLSWVRDGDASSLLALRFRRGLCGVVRVKVVSTCKSGMKQIVSLVERVCCAVELLGAGVLSAGVSTVFVGHSTTREARHNNAATLCRSAAYCHSGSVAAAFRAADANSRT